MLAPRTASGETAEISAVPPLVGALSKAVGRTVITLTASDDFDDSERVARADRPHEGGLVPRLEHVRNLRHVEKRRHARQQPLAEGGAASPCGNSAATARIRGWPRTTGQHAIVGQWLRRGRCSLVGTDRPQLEVAGQLVRPHGAGVQAANQSGQISARF